MTGRDAVGQILALFEDNLITEEQIIALSTIAAEFARLNEAVASLKHESYKLLCASKHIIDILEPAKI
jgi:hypothetical protein